MRSSAVSDDSPVARNLVEVLLDLVRRHADRAWQLRFGLAPSLRVARVHEGERLASVHPLFHFLNGDSGGFRRLPLLHLIRTSLRVYFLTIFYYYPALDVRLCMGN